MIGLFTCALIATQLEVRLLLFVSATWAASFPCGPGTHPVSAPARKSKHWHHKGIWIYSDAKRLHSSPPPLLKSWLLPRPTANFYYTHSVWWFEKKTKTAGLWAHWVDSDLARTIKLLLQLQDVSVTHLLFDSRQIQLGYLVIETVLEQTNPVLLLLEMLLDGGDLKWPHFLLDTYKITHTHKQRTQYMMVWAHCGKP